MSDDASAWTPPHCPNPQCDSHQKSLGWRFKKAGFFRRERAPHRVQRYRCSRCDRNFSSQTFSTTYWLKRPDCLEPVFLAEVNGSGHRQIARQLSISHATVQRHVERLGRHCLLVHESLRSRARARIATEDCVLDGLGAFAGGQYWPFELTTVIGARSYYSHDFTVTEKRRAGRQRPDQKARRARYEARLGRPDPRGLKRDVLELVEASLPERVPIVLRSDEKKEYGWALARLPGHRITRETTHSKKPRTPRNRLFPINAHHGFLRHSGANHKRETIAFSKRLQAAIYRHAIFQAWRNLVKAASERRPYQTPAQRLGVTQRRWTAAEILGRRRFVTRMRLRPRVAAYYGGEVRSRFCAREREHALRYAF